MTTMLLATAPRTPLESATPAAAPICAGALDGSWRLAYLITGDRALAHRIVDELLADGVTDPARLRAAVVVRARAERRRLAASTSDPRHELLWSALQRLPRRERAAIVARLAA